MDLRAAATSERGLFVVALALALAPIWSVEYLPTTDGPCHTYNAWAHLHLDSPEHPVLRRHYEVNRRPLPNWLGHAVLVPLAALVEPRTAEKLLVSAYLLLFLAGARLLAGAVEGERRWLGLLALPLAFNQLFQMGFYNFSLGLALWMVTVAWWWRRRADPDLAFAVGLNLLLSALFFAHLVPHGLALGAIGVLWLVTLSRATWRRHLLHGAILAPQAVLPLWFLASTGGGWVGSGMSFGASLASFLQLRILVAFGPPQLWLGRLVAATFLALALVTVRHRLRRAEKRPPPSLAVRDRPRRLAAEDGFLLLALLLAILFLAAPEGRGQGSLLKARLSLFPWLALLPWIGSGLRRGLRRALACWLLLPVAAHAAYLVGRYRAVDAEIREHLRVTEAIAPGSRVLPLLFERGSEHARLPLLGHAIGYAAIERGLIDWDNYEAASDLFPLRFREDVARPDVFAIEADPGSLDVRAHRAQADYVFCWKMPEGAPLARQLARHYRLAAEHGHARLYERRPRPRPPGEGRR